MGGKGCNGRCRNSRAYTRTQTLVEAYLLLLLIIGPNRSSEYLIFFLQGLASAHPIRYRIYKFSPIASYTDVIAIDA